MADQAMCFDPGGNLKSIDMIFKGLSGNSVFTARILLEKHRRRNLDVCDFSSRAVIAEETQQHRSGGAGKIGGIPDEVCARSEVSAGRFSCSLDDATLVLSVFDACCPAHIVKRYDWPALSILCDPAVLSGSWKAAHQCCGAGVFFVGGMRKGAIGAREGSNATFIIGKGVGRPEAPCLGKLKGGKINGFQKAGLIGADTTPRISSCMETQISCVADPGQLCSHSIGIFPIYQPERCLMG
jgi:hypothetical protein